MHVLIEIVLKSLLIAGLTLGLLHVLKSRSAAERSWIAHIGLFALVIMALAPLVLPSWSIEAPALFGPAKAVAPIAQPVPVTPVTVSTVPPISPSAQHAVKAAPALASMSPIAAAMALYAVPAAILLLITFLALVRLVALQARADVLVDGHWLSALARAQRRMGFKHGTALLTSDELASPISWGLVRPVIVLNKRAVEAANDAEAIIAHELAHVARMDWVKLLLARVATALFWFNPLVWMLAREAHQLREEAADDSVLEADIVDTDYAQLLVGVARHECPGLLLGAHGVAPSKSSLARRVARVLDGKSVRGPAARSFALGVFAGAILVAAPLAALTVTPAVTKAPKLASGKLTASEPLAPYYPAHDEPTDLPHIIAKGVSTSVTTAMAAVAPNIQLNDTSGDFEAVGSSGASVRSHNGTTVATAQNGATLTMYPPDAHGRRKVVAVAPNGATSISYAGPNDSIDAADAADSADAAEAVADARAGRLRNGAIDKAIELKAVGVTQAFAAEMRAASPGLRNATLNDIVELKAVGVTPAYVHEIASAGFGNLGASDLTQARAVGLDPGYVRGMRSAGFGDSVEDFVQMRAMGITPAYAEQFRRAGYRLSVEKLVEMKAQGIDVEDLRDPPPPPPPPGRHR
jgi:beta-lactamase regulating signal transducer with metallopeptidase domain